MKQLIPQEMIETQIYNIRGQKVLLDRDLARLYGVQTKVLKQAVNRNIERFPDDFMFQLNSKEFKNWRSQIVTSNPGDRMGLRYRPYAFTQEGVAMLSSVLNSERAIQVNIAIMRTFIKLREIMVTHKDLARKIDDMERKYDVQFKVVFEAIRRLLTPPEKLKKRIGFYKE
jgi:phage regulator Rha-like protein